MSDKKYNGNDVINTMIIPTYITAILFFKYKVIGAYNQILKIKEVMYAPKGTADNSKGVYCKLTSLLLLA